MPEDIGESITLLNGETLKTHRKDACTGPPCVIHSPSDHPLKGAPLFWRPERMLMERVCEHGVHHPDPDDRSHWERRIGDDPISRGFLDLRIEHEDCDGCCTGTYEEPEPPGPTQIEKLQEVIRLYGATWTEGREHGPFPHLPDGGELRIVDALECVLRSMKIAEDRDIASVSVILLTEMIAYSFSDLKWSVEQQKYRAQHSPDSLLSHVPPPDPDGIDSWHQ